MSIPCVTINGEIYENGNMPIMTPLAVFIAEELERLQWSQVQLQEVSGISDTTLGRIRNGQEAKPSQLAHLAKAFGCKFWYILQRAGYAIDDPGSPSENAQRLGTIVADNPELSALLDGVLRLSMPNRRAVVRMIQALLGEQEAPPAPPASE